MVALQVRDVPEAVRASLASEAERRGQSLQLYMLEILEREAATLANRGFLRSYSGPLADGRRTRVDARTVVRQDRLRDTV